MAVPLTLGLVALPYVAAFAVAYVNPWAVAGLPALVLATPVMFRAIQRLVLFMLTGEVERDPHIIVLRKRVSGEAPP